MLKKKKWNKKWCDVLKPKLRSSQSVFWNVRRILSQTKALTVEEELIAVRWRRIPFIGLRALLLNAPQMYHIHATWYRVLHGRAHYLLYALRSTRMQTAERRERNLCYDVNESHVQCSSTNPSYFQQVVCGVFFDEYLLYVRGLWTWFTYVG